MNGIRVLVVDDHALFRRGVTGLLRAEKGFQVIGEAGDGAEAVAKATALNPDVVLMDISMPGMSGLEATRRIGESTPGTKVVILTVSDEDHSVFEAIKVGAHAYLLKSVEPDELVRTIRGVMGGEVFVTPRLAARIIEEFARGARTGARAPGKSVPARRLSPREEEVLALLTRGAANKEIAATLGISENTVKNHLKRIMEKLHLENRVQVVSYALREGLVKAAPPE